MVQNPKGGGLSSSFGGDTQQIGGVKKTTDFLDKTTWILASLILVLILFSNITLNSESDNFESELIQNQEHLDIQEPLEAETKTASGIIIPDTAKEKPQKGNIVSVGPGTKDNPVTLKQGMTVLYGKYSGTELKLDGKDYLIMRESDILAIV